MSKRFNTTAVCIPSEHYMVNIDNRLKQIKQLVDENKYFTINRARQYGKTTTLRALYRYLKSEYYVVLMDFQTFGSLNILLQSRLQIPLSGYFSAMIRLSIIR